MTADVLSDSTAVYTAGISQRRGTATTYDLHDRLGSSPIQTSSAAATTSTRTYDAFGILMASTGSILGPFGFAATSGYQEEKDTRLKLLGHRYYDPETGRFLTRDPIGDGRNWYAYCDNNPLRYTDPTGLLIPLVAALVVVGVIAIGVGVWSYYHNKDGGAGSAASDGFSVPAYQAPSGSGELAGGADAGIKGVGTIAPEVYRRNAMQACEAGNEQACDDADAYERGEGPPPYVDGHARPLYKVR